MATLYLIFGLAGSGKSYYATEVLGLSEEFHEGFALSQDMQRKLIHDLQRGTDCTVSEIAYLNITNRQRFLAAIKNEVPNVNIFEIYFEKDLESANWNCQHRTNKGGAAGHIELNRRLFEVYEIPSGKDTIPIKRINSD